MDIDTDRIDEAVLALPWLGLHDGLRAWKTFDWDAMGRLHAKVVWCMDVAVASAGRIG